MITITNANTVDLRGLSTDVKPIVGTDDEGNATNAWLGNGSTFLEIDTSKVYIFDKENNEWVEFNRTESQEG